MDGLNFGTKQLHLETGNLLITYFLPLLQFDHPRPFLSQLRLILLLPHLSHNLHPLIIFQPVIISLKFVCYFVLLLFSAFELLLQPEILYLVLSQIVELFLQSNRNLLLFSLLRFKLAAALLDAIFKTCTFLLHEFVSTFELFKLHSPLLGLA